MFRKKLTWEERFGDKILKLQDVFDWDYEFDEETKSYYLAQTDRNVRLENLEKALLQKILKNGKVVMGGRWGEEGFSVWKIFQLKRKYYLVVWRDSLNARDRYWYPVLKGVVKNIKSLERREE